MAAVRNDANLSNELFVVKGDNTLWRFYQDPGASLWRKTQIPLPSLNKIIHKNTYTTHISIRDEDNRPISYKTFRLTASNWTSVTINGESHSLGSKNLATVKSNSLGHITLIFEVDSIASPVFHLHADFFESPINFNPANRVLTKLKNIKDHRAFRKELEDNDLLEGKSIDDVTLKHAFDSMQLIIGAMDTLPSDGSNKKLERSNSFQGPSGEQGQLYAFEFKDGKLLRHQDETVVNLLNTLDQSELIPNDNFKNIFDDVLHDIGDFIVWVGSGLLKVEKWYINVLKKEVQLLIHIGGKILTFAFKALEETYHAINWLLKGSLGIDTDEYLDKFIKWLGYEFGWDDIITTHKVMANVFKQGLKSTRSEIKCIETEINTFFDNLIQKVEELWKPTAKPYGQSSVKGFTQSNTGQNASSNEALGYMSNPQFNYASYHMQYSGVISQDIPFSSPAGPIGDFIQNVIVPAFESIKETIKTLYKDIYDEFSTGTLSYNDFFEKLSVQFVTGMLKTVNLA